MALTTESLSFTLMDRADVGLVPMRAEAGPKRRALNKPLLALGLTER
jgi:hypothetical protein